MRTLRHKLLLAIALSVGAASGAFAQFTSGNLAVSRVGDGTQALSNTGNSVFIDQFTTTGTLISSLALPATGAGAIVTSGTATSEGTLTRSADGRYLTYTGYGRDVGGTGSVVATTSSAVPRVIARIDAQGNVDTTTRLTDAFSTNNPRSAVTNDGTTFYASGAVDGTRFATLGATTSTVVSNTQVNQRVVNIFNGNLYYSTGSGTAGIYQVGTGGLPTTSGQTPTLLAGASSPYDFFLTPDALTLYVASDTSAAVGLQKFTRTSSASAFSLAYNISTASISGATTGLRGLAVDLNTAGGPTLYAVTATSTTGGNSVVSLVDTGSTSTFNVLATAATNTAFRGVDFTPIGAAVPEPGTLALLGTGLTGLGGMLAARRRKNKA